MTLPRTATGQVNVRCILADANGPVFPPLARSRRERGSDPGRMRPWTSELLVLLSVPPIPRRHATVACVRGSEWAELNAALQSEDFMGVIGTAGLNRWRPGHSLGPSPKP